MNDRYLGSCGRAVKMLSLPDRHCESCHYDYEELDYEMCEIETRAGRYHCCCFVMEAYDDRKKLRPECNVSGELRI